MCDARITKAEGQSSSRCVQWRCDYNKDVAVGGKPGFAVLSALQGAAGMYWKSLLIAGVLH